MSTLVFSEPASQILYIDVIDEEMKTEHTTAARCSVGPVEVFHFHYSSPFFHKSKIGIYS
jgi:hypothetical protein